MDIRKEKNVNLITDLTLGLFDTLTTLVGVRDVSIGLRQGAEKAILVAWEQRHGVVLPNSLKQLYLTSDGFSLTWNYAVAGKVLPLGNMELHPISKVNRVGSGRSSGDPLTPSLADLAMAEEVSSTTTTSQQQQQETLTQDNLGLGPVQIEVFATPRKKSKGGVTPTFHVSKLFEIDGCKGNGRVVLAYPGRGETFPEASFWFIDLSHRLHLLSLDVTTYWRLLLVFLGMPQWQALAVGLGLTPWARQWYEVLTPHLLEGSFRQQRSCQPDLINKLDWSIFKAKKANKNRTVKEGQKDQSKNSKDGIVESAKLSKDPQKGKGSKLDSAKEISKSN